MLAQTLVQAAGTVKREAQMKLTIFRTSLAKAQDADLIALGHYKHAFLEKRVREIAIKKGAFRTTLPIGVLPNSV